jgi:hypothetical protein
MLKQKEFGTSHDLIRLLSQHGSGGTEESHKKPYLELPVARLRFEKSTPSIKVYSATTTPPSSVTTHRMG